jgi:hypothetical protein
MRFVGNVRTKCNHICFHCCLHVAAVQFIFIRGICSGSLLLLTLPYFVFRSCFFRIVHCKILLVIIGPTFQYVTCISVTCFIVELLYLCLKKILCLSLLCLKIKTESYQAASYLGKRFEPVLFSCL